MALPIKVIIADDHFLFADGLEQILLGVPNFEVIAKVEDGKLLMHTLNSLKPDLLLLDINMPYLSGIEAAPLIKEKFPSIKIVFLSMYSEANITELIKGSHANGFLNKSIMAFDLKKALLQIIEGEDIFLFQTKKEKKKSLEGDKFSKKSKLSPREKEIITYIEQGKTSGEISFILNLSEYTVETHRKNIFRKLQVKNMAEMIAFISKNS